MLIIFRKNPGFEGQIVSVDKTTLAPEMDAYLAANPDVAAEIGYLDIDEYLIGRENLQDFAANRERYSVDVANLRLLKDGAPVQWG